MHTDETAGMCKRARMDVHQEAAHAIVEKMMEATGLDATNLARRAKVAPSTLTRFLNGDVKHSLSLKTLTKLSQASGVPLPSSIVASSEVETVPIVGYVGAGYKFYPFDDALLGDGLEQVPAPPGSDANLVAVGVKGSSMIPSFAEGDLLFYTRDAGFDRDECLYQECVVKLVAGEIYVKVIKPGRTPHTFNLESFNAAPIMDVEIEWAAPVLHIDRTRRKARAAMEVQGKTRTPKRRKVE